MTINCRATNYYGDSSESIDLYVKRTNYIDVITIPEGNPWKSYYSKNNKCQFIYEDLFSDSII